MKRPKKTDNSASEHAEATKSRRRFRLEWSTTQLVVACVGLVFVLSWMFIFGVLIGRGIPLVSSKEVSYRAQFLRFLGLGRETPPPPVRAAETWDSPQKIMESLNYYQDLTQKEVPQPSASAKTSNPATASTPPPTQAQQAKRPSSEPSAPAPKASSAQSKTAQEPSQEAGPSDPSSEHFTLLISSLRDSENAQRLVEQLRSKGYKTRVETLALSGSGRWNRVLVGSFQSREEALRFAAEFNKKERLEALVIRESH